MNVHVVKAVKASDITTCWRGMWCCCCCADLSMTIAIAVEVRLTEDVEVEETERIEKEQSERRQKDGGDGGCVYVGGMRGVGEGRDIEVPDLGWRP